MALLPQKGDTGFTLGGFLILAALGTFLWSGAPLESVRPNSEQSGRYDHKLSQQLPARLWQDPFKAVYAHEQAIKAGTASASYNKLPHLKIIEDLEANKGELDLSLLMIQVSPGSYAELEERRRRRRYAVLSGLGDEHFVPRNPEVLNVFYRPVTGSQVKDCFTENKYGKQNIPAKECYSVPYEWYDYENPTTKTTNQKKVLVLWLNETQFVDSPLLSIKDLLEDLLPRENISGDFNLSATLLGPARSDALRNLVTKRGKEERNAYQWLRCSSGLSEFNIISSTATVADTDLMRSSYSNSDVDLQKDSPLEKLRKNIAKADCSEKQNNKSPAQNMHFLRTIQSDEVLIEKLATELTKNRLISAKDDYVVVISEWDTYFGRSLPRAFTRHFCDTGCGEDNIVRYSYQRGMDGIVAGQQNQANQSRGSNQPKSDARSPSIDAATMRRPVGTGQFDYLRRLATDIHKKDREWRLETGHGVRAVVLLGSDVYDKLLILRALRPELPGAIFATTDLDAHLLHPAEYNWARSLIVASTYNLSLSLPSNVTMTTMPFRDSYQTSVYLATRLSFNSELMKEVKSSQEGIYQKIPPQLMEIGRQNLIELSSNEDINDSWNRLSGKSFTLPVTLGLVTMAILGIFAFHQLRPMAGRVVAVLAVLLLVFSLLGVIISIQQTGGEPVNFFAGASIWPTEYIRLFSVVLALVFIWSVIHILHRNWNDLGARYFWKGPESGPDGITLTQLLGKLVAWARHPIQNLKLIKLTQVLPALMVIILIVVMSRVLPIPLPLIEKIPMLIAVWSGLIVLWWVTIYGHIRKDLHVLPINKWIDKCEENKDAVEMWRIYGKYGAGDHRFMRTLAYILIYFAFASFLFAILGSPASPCRGEVACTMDKAILGFSVLAMLVLLFLVVDAARLCICWVDSMRRPDVDWSNTRIAEYIQNLRLPDTHAVAWIQIHLIGERTSEVTRLIYYPVLIILLLLLSRSTYFDNWDFPQALAIVIVLNFTIALGSVVRLNYVAQSVREDILRKLQDEKLAAGRKEDISYEPSTTERQELIHQLESLRIGAYLRVWDQPPVRATLMLLGGVALTYAEYITVFLN